MAEDGNAETKLQKILDLACALGLRCPTEPCLKWLCCLWLMVSQDDGDVDLMDATAKACYMAIVKNRMKSLRKHLADPISYVQVLPESPVQFLKEQPLLFRAALGESVPVQPKLNQLKLRALDASFGCRGGGGCVVATRQQRAMALAAQPLQQQQQQQQQQQPNNIDITQLLLSQQKMMQAIMLGRAGPQRTGDDIPITVTPRINRARTWLEAPSVEKAAAAVPQLAIAEQRPPLPPPLSPSTPASRSKEPPRLIATAACDDEDEDGGSDGGEQPQVKDFLDMLEERTSERSKAARERAKVAKAEAALDASGGKSAAKVVATKGKASATKKEIAAKRKVVADSPAKAAVKAPVKAGMLLKATDLFEKGSKTAAATAGKAGKMKLGCGKCRGNHCGCVQCRSTSFKGKRWQK